MTDEENKLIEEMINRSKEHCVDDVDYSVPFLISLIEKQSKEIEEYKECERLSKRQLEKQKNDLERLEIEIEELKNTETYKIAIIDKDKYISKDKIKEILGIEENIDNDKLLSLLQTIVDENARLEDIEDRKVQIEYNNVFNKGVKSLEDKIKAILEKYKYTEIGNSEKIIEFYKELQLLLEEE